MAIDDLSAAGKVKNFKTLMSKRLGEEARRLNAIKENVNETGNDAGKCQILNDCYAAYKGIEARTAEVIKRANAFLLEDGTPPTDAEYQTLVHEFEALVGEDAIPLHMRSAPGTAAAERAWTNMPKGLQTYDQSHDQIATAYNVFLNQHVQ